MPNTYTTLSSLFTAIANALRSLKGTSAPIVADNFPSEISSIASKSAQTYTPTTADQTIAAGQYLSGAQTVKGDANLVAENIKKDVTIFGVTGTFAGGGSASDLDEFCKGTLTDLVLTSATVIRNYAAYYNTGLTSVSAVEATSIGGYSFQGCSNLVSASFAKATNIGYYAFYDLTNLASVSIPLCTTLGTYAFQGCQKGVLSAALKATNVGMYAMQYFGKTAVTGFAWEPANNATVYQHGFDGSRITRINGKVTSIDKYAFDGAEWLESYNNTATLSTLSQYAFRNAGKSRADTTVALVLDFHTGTFSSVQQYTLAGLVNTVVTLPSTVTSLDANAFSGITGSIVIITGNTPTMSSTTVFGGWINSFVAVPYNNLYSAKQAANWNAIADNIIGYAPAGTYTEGDTLPTQDSGNRDIYWTTDTTGNYWVTECPAGSPILYCRFGLKTGVWVDSSVTSVTITVTGSDSTVYPFTDGRATLPAGITFSINAEIPSGWDNNITLDGVAVQNWPVTGLTADHDYKLVGDAWNPSATGVNWATDAWAIVQNTSKAGLTATTYGNQVGATRTITLTNGNTMTIRLSNADDTMYARNDDSGTTGLCMDFVDCFPEVWQMNANHSCNGGWNACQMRTVRMAQLFDLLPSDLAAVIETVKIPTANGGGNASIVINSADKLFLLAGKEVFGTSTYSVTAEANVLTQWAWYATHNINPDRIKKVSGSASGWWLRSPYGGNNFGWVGISGMANYNNASATLGVSPGFCI